MPDWSVALATPRRGWAHLYHPTIQPRCRGPFVCGCECLSPPLRHKGESAWSYGMLPAQCLPNIVAKPEASESRWGADDGDRVAHRSGVSSSHGKLESACMGISPSSPDLIAMSLMATKTARMPTALGSAADPDVGLLQAQPGRIIPHSNRNMGGRTGGRRGRRAGTRALARPCQRIARLAVGLWSPSHSPSR